MDLQQAERLGTGNGYSISNEYYDDDAVEDAFKK